LYGTGSVFGVLLPKAMVHHSKNAAYNRQKIIHRYSIARKNGLPFLFANNIQQMKNSIIIKIIKTGLKRNRSAA